MKERESYQAELNAELERRIGELERDPTALPKRFSRGNYIAAAVTAGLCLLAVILGARL